MKTFKNILILILVIYHCVCLNINFSRNKNKNLGKRYSSFLSSTESLPEPSMDYDDVNLFADLENMDSFDANEKNKTKIINEDLNLNNKIQSDTPTNQNVNSTVNKITFKAKRNEVDVKKNVNKNEVDKLKKNEKTLSDSKVKLENTSTDNINNSTLNIKNNSTKTSSKIKTPYVPKKKKYLENLNLNSNNDLKKKKKTSNFPADTKKKDENNIEKNKSDKSNSSNKKNNKNNDKVKIEAKKLTDNDKVIENIKKDSNIINDNKNTKEIDKISNNIIKTDSDFINKINKEDIVNIEENKKSLENVKDTSILEENSNNEKKEESKNINKATKTTNNKSIINLSDSKSELDKLNFEIEDDDEFIELKETKKTKNQNANKNKNNKKVKEKVVEIIKDVTLTDETNTETTPIKEITNKGKSKLIDKKEENNKLFSQLDPNFVENLLKMQNNPNIKKLIKQNNKSIDKSDNNNDDEELNPLFLQTKSEKIIPNQNLNQKERINKNQIKSLFKPEELDLSKITYINNLITKMRNNVQKKTIENEQLTNTNNQLEKNYEQLNSQLLIYQTKMDSITNEINLFNSIKSHYSNQIDKIKEGNNIINEINDFFKKINEDITLKEDSIQKYEQKVQNDLKSFIEEKKKLEKDFHTKNRQLEIIKKSFLNLEKNKLELVDNIRTKFEEFSKEEIKFLKLKNEENELELQVKNEENQEKLIAMEIEHLKMTNLMEIQKIEELKQEIEKSKNLRDYLKKEIEELEEKLKNYDGENKQNQIEYELKKNELEEKLKSLKEEVKSEESLNKEEIEKYNKIENDIKNKISYVSLQNSNVMTDNVRDNNNRDDENLNKKINNSFYSFKSKEVNPKYEEKESNNSNSNQQDEGKLKNQILLLLKKLNE